MIGPSSPNYITAYASVGGVPISKLTDIKSKYSNVVQSQSKRPAHHKRLEFVRPSTTAAQMINECISLPVQTQTGATPQNGSSPTRTYYTANTADMRGSLSPPDEEEDEDEEVHHSYSESLESKTQDQQQQQ